MSDEDTPVPPAVERDRIDTVLGRTVLALTDLADAAR